MLAIITVFRVNENETVDGGWVQHFCRGGVEEAIEHAKSLEKLNGSKTDYAVVESARGGGPLNNCYSCKRLDTRRITPEWQLDANSQMVRTTKAA